MEALAVIFGLAIRVGQIMAIIVCFKKQSPYRLKICGGVGAILFFIASISIAMR